MHGSNTCMVVVVRDLILPQGVSVFFYSSCGKLLLVFGKDGNPSYTVGASTADYPYRGFVCYTRCSGRHPITRTRRVTTKTPGVQPLRARQLKVQLLIAETKLMKNVLSLFLRALKSFHLASLKRT